MSTHGDSIRVLFLGDIVGAPGLRAVVTMLPGLRKDVGSDFVVINGENATDGYGLTEEQALQLFGVGCNVITTGNHVWQQSSFTDALERHENILRPANYPPGVPGHGVCVADAKGTKIAVINLQGRVRMPTIDCPFRKAKELLRKVRQDVSFVLVDFHAEATEEKEALAYYLDGEVAAFVGTHTHVQTADERILPKGTAYLTDLGACAPRDSVIGFDGDISVQRVLTHIPIRNEVPNHPANLNGLIVDVDPATGRAVHLERLLRNSLV